MVGEASSLLQADINVSTINLASFNFLNCCTRSSGVMFFNSSAHVLSMLTNNDSAYSGDPSSDIPSGFFITFFTVNELDKSKSKT